METETAAPGIASEAAPQRGGVLLRYWEAAAAPGAPESGGPAGEERLAFVPADVARCVSILGAQAAVRGLRPPATGVAFADGEVVTVLELGTGRGAAPARGYRPGDDWPLPGATRAVLCDLGAHRVALVGATVVATGLFDDAGAEGPAGAGAILWRGERVALLDLRALYGLAEAAIWSGRASPRKGDAS